MRVGLDPGLASRMQAALVGLSGTPDGRKVIAGSTKGLTGFAIAADGLYDPVRRTALAAGM